MDRAIEPKLETIRQAQEFLEKYFALTQLIAAPFLSAAVGALRHLRRRLGESGGSDCASAFTLAAEYAKQPGVFF